MSNSSAQGLPAASLCPLCGAGNACAMTAGADPASCWCMQTKISADALQQAQALRAPSAAPEQCLCRACGAASASPTTPPSHSG